MKELIVEEGAKRLDKYIAEREELSRATIQRLIEEENILVNGKVTKASYQVQSADRISIAIPEVKTTDLKAQEIPLDIIYEDDDIIVVNKAKGMVVHPAARKPRWYISKCHYVTLQREFIRYWW